MGTFLRSIYLFLLRIGSRFCVEGPQAPSDMETEGLTGLRKAVIVMVMVYAVKG